MNYKFFHPVMHVGDVAIGAFLHKNASDESMYRRSVFVYQNHGKAYNDTAVL